MAPDVLVIGGGNAALCAALMAREAGASVMLLEAAPRVWRGGNSTHTRNLRCMHDAPQDVLVDAYTPDMVSLVAQLRLFKSGEGDSFVQGGTLRLPGFGAWAVSCSGP